MLQLGYEDLEADPRIYQSGVVQTYSYANGEFSDSASSDLEIAIPASRDDVLAVYPTCAG